MVLDLTKLSEVHILLKIALERMDNLKTNIIESERFIFDAIKELEKIKEN